jgi:virulence factor Mce-like protein
MSTATNRSNLIARGVMLLATAAIAVVIVLVLTGGSSYVLKLRLANASGVRPGSQVLLGGVSVGTVYKVDFDRRDNFVVADLHLTKDKHKLSIGQGVTASIVAANLLGEKYVALSPGDARHPLPSGTVLPEAATTIPTDLDTIVDVLDGPTRARLAILLDQAGTAVAGRQSDVRAILAQFPASLQAATKLLNGLVQDNHTLGDVVANTNSFIGRLNASSGDLKQAIDAAAGATTTLALRAAALKEAVIGAPRTVQNIHDAFFNVTNAVDALTPFLYRTLDSAPYLSQLLTEVKPFTQAAVPALNRAAAVSPTLTKLADQGTPTIRQAVPTLSALSNLATLAKPLSGWLGLSAPDLIGILPGWDSAVAWRDGMSHTFQGEIYLDPQIVVGVANHGATPAQRRQNLLDIINPTLLRTLGLVGAYNRAKAEAANPQTPAAKPAHKPAGLPLPKLNLPSSKPGAPGSAPAAGGQATGGNHPSLGSLLGGVLGALGGKGHSGGGSGSGAGSTGASTPTNTGSKPSLGSTLQNLLGYLLGK